MNMIYFVIATICALISGIVASGKGRSAFGFGMLGFFFPVVGIVAACCLPAVKASDSVAMQAEVARIQ